MTWVFRHLIPSAIALSVLLVRPASAGGGDAGEFTSRFPPEYRGESLLISQTDRQAAQKQLQGSEGWRAVLQTRFQSGTYLPLTVSSIVSELRIEKGYVDQVNACRDLRATRECESRTLAAIWKVARTEGIFDDCVYSALARATSLANDQWEFEAKPALDQAIEDYDQKRLVVETLGQDSGRDESFTGDRPTHRDYVLWDADGKRTLRVRLYELYSADEILLLAQWARDVILRMNAFQAQVIFQHETLGTDSFELTFQQKREFAKQRLDRDAQAAVAEKRIHRLPEEIDVFAAAVEKGIFSMGGMDAVLSLPEFQSRHTKRDRNRRIAGGVYRVASTAVLFVPVYGGWLSLLMSLGSSIYENRRATRPAR